ncbi:Zona pellucida domain-containing protein [Strongyloides ratti]|uniref:Zona pellucida domain-containing protein n=1 Tax=Strongyloides ratti TaxID=34506 RepID=A0A090MMY1_STRRB|nr:Zona pellucida domain-containing protein [Strongyloides ratti]CEF59396.1 Zona pellucida domain-containing protein [Strongyloides ratti]
MISSNINLLLLIFSIILYNVTFQLPEKFFNNRKVIELPISKFPEPECIYNVLEGTKFGNKVSREVNIGEPLYHKWSCNYKNHHNNMYCIMVHNCTVSHSKDNSNNQIIPIIDEFGCSYYPSIIPHIEYIDDLQGGLPVNAFKDLIVLHCHNINQLTIKLKDDASYYYRYISIYKNY